MQRKKKWIIRTFISAIVCLAAVIWAFLSIRHLPKYDYSIDDWKSENAVYRDNGFSIDEDIKDSGKSIEFLWGPYMPLKKGSYTANIHYSASEDQMCFATASGGASELFDSSDGILSKYLHTVSYQFETVDDVPEFQLVIRYSGLGDFTVQSISITPNGNQAKRIAVKIIAIVLLTDSLIFFFEQDLHKKNTIVALAGITFLVSLPLFIHGQMAGHDYNFHLCRVEAIVQALRSHQFPARISSISLYGLGYPLSIYYNDLFLYFPALLRILGFSVDNAFKIYIFCINLLTVCGAYYSFRTIFRNQNIGLISALLYTSASYRLVNIYVRCAVGEFTAQTFLPLLALVLYRIYNEKSGQMSKILKNSILLTMCMSGFISSHILSTLIIIFAMLLIFLVFIRKTIHKNVIATLMLAVFFTILVKAYYLIPLIDYYFNIRTKINTVIDNIHPIQKSGAFPAQYFAFFHSVFGWLSSIDDRMQLTPGLPLILVLFAGCYFRLFHKKDKSLDFLLWFIFIWLWLASDLFPWNWLMMHFGFWNIMTSIQFPFRFLILGLLFLVLLAGYILKNYKIHSFSIIISGIAILMTLWFTSSLFNSSGSVYIYDTSSLRFDGIGGGEYMLNGSSARGAVFNAGGSNMLEIRANYQNSNTLNLYCRTDGTKENHLIVVPVYNYKGYHVFDDYGNEFPIINADENYISFNLPDEFDGNVSVVFKGPIYWTIALYVSSISFLTLIFLLFRKLKK